MKKEALKPAKSRKQAAEITAKYLESEADCVADIPSEGFSHDLYQLGKDFYLVETLLFLDGNRCNENPCALLPIQGFSKAAIAMRRKRITSTKTVAKLSRKQAVQWFIANAAPWMIEKETKDRAEENDDDIRWIDEVLEGIDPLLRAKYKRLAKKAGKTEAELAIEALGLWLEAQESERSAR